MQSQEAAKVPKATNLGAQPTQPAKPVRKLSSPVPPEGVSKLPARQLRPMTSPKMIAEQLLKKQGVATPIGSPHPSSVAAAQSAYFEKQQTAKTRNKLIGQNTGPVASMAGHSDSLSSGGGSQPNIQASMTVAGVYGTGTQSQQ